MKEALAIKKSGWVLKSAERKGCFGSAWKKQYLVLVGTTLTFSPKENSVDGITIEITPNVVIDADSTLDFACSFVLHRHISHMQ